MSSGYKQTEGGLIPEEWDVVPLEKLIYDFRGGAPFRPNDFTKTGIKVLPKGGVGRSGWLRIAEADQQYCSPTYAAAHSNNQVDKEYAIVVLRDLVPSGPSIGLVVRIDDLETYLLAQGVYGFKTLGQLCPGYLVQLSNTHWYRQTMNSIMVGSTQVHITNTAFNRVKIPLPKPNEQRAIVTSLSDVDNLLSALDRVLSKKHDLKKATMQKLLSGKTRLPGFSGNWNLKRIGDIAPLQRGFDLPNRNLRSGIYPVVYSNGIMNYHAEGPVKGPGVITGRSGTIGKVTFVEGPFWPHNTALWVTSFKGNDPRYVFYLYVAIGFERFASGSGVPTLNRNDAHSFEIEIPPTIEEQSAIAAVLSDMDIEIETLELRLRKTRALKQGMMQQLLTGKTRLISHESSHA